MRTGMRTGMKTATKTAMRTARRPFPRRSRAADLPGVSGAARLERRAVDVVPRLRPGDIAIIDAVDLDRETAEALLARRVGGVVNASPSISGRYPALGSQVLVRAGTPLVDAVGADVLGRVHDGSPVRLHGGTLFAGESPVAVGHEQTPDTVAEALRLAGSGLAAQLAAVSGCAGEVLRRHADAYLDGSGLPRLATVLEGRPVVLVTGSAEARAQVRRLRSYLAETRPVLVGVGAGADVLRAAGHRPDLIVADPGDAALSDEALRCGAEVVLHGGRNAAAARERLDRLEIVAPRLDVPGRTLDAAVLLAVRRGAALVVTAGARHGLDDLLDRSTPDAAVSLLTRMRAGARVVDADTVRALHRPRVGTGWVLLLLVVALVCLVVAVGVTPVGQDLLERVLGSR